MIMREYRITDGNAESFYAPKKDLSKLTPELVLDINSPRERAYDLLRKVLEFFKFLKGKNKLYS